MAMRIIVMISMIQVMLWGGAGDIDSSFDGDGKVTTAVGSSTDYALSVAIQNDGKIVAAGYSLNGSYYEFAVVRYDTEGNLDSTFNDDGKVTTAIGSSEDKAQSVAIQNDGKIVVAGYSWGSNYDFAVVRYDTEGNLDSTFGDGGIVTKAIGSGNDYAQSIAIQSDGKIVVAGYSWNGSNYDFAVVRYDTEGNLDSTFGDGGIVTKAIGSDNDEANSVAIQSDGKIVVAGYSHNAGFDDFTVVRYDTEGKLDSTFGDGGIVTTAIVCGNDKAQGVAIQSNGKIVVTGTIDNGSYYKFAVARYDTNGKLDSTFGDGGIVTTAIGSSDGAYSIAIQSNGKIVVTGTSDNGSNNDFAVVRYDTDGKLDSTFGDDGIVTTAIGGSGDYARSIAIQSNGKIVVAGYSYNGNNQDFAVVRYIGDPVTLAPIYYLLQ